MEQKFNNNPLNLQSLQEFCKREGKGIVYRKGTSWNASVTQHDGSLLLLKGDFNLPLWIICLAWLNFFSLSSLGTPCPPLGVIHVLVLASPLPENCTSIMNLVLTIPQGLQ